MNISITSNKSRTKKVLWGIILLLTVAAIIISAIGLWEFPQISVGGIIWTVLSIILLIEGISGRNFFIICMPLSILAIVWKQHIGLADINNWLLVLCGLLLSIALHFIFPSYRKKKDYKFNVNGRDYTKEEWKNFKDSCNDNTSTNFSEASYEELNDNDNTEVNFGEQTKYYKSQAFQSAHLESNFGCIKAFFTDAKMLNNSAHVVVECNFGAAELFIPKEWEVKFTKEGAFSGVEHVGSVEWDGVHTLYIESEVNFGGLKIHHV